MKECFFMSNVCFSNNRFYCDMSNILDLCVYVTKVYSTFILEWTSQQVT
jgi:hypothetical protein